MKRHAGRACGAGYGAGKRGGRAGERVGGQACGRHAKGVKRKLEIVGGQALRVMGGWGTGAICCSCDPQTLTDVADADRVRRVVPEANLDTTTKPKSRHQRDAV